ncbi:hypothetical protein GCM10020367_15440 [Streptomyces sannanensis]|uniref:Uncharacterized protein n=1 Tax=Streptomyces sannanensis TaxID=285536 RepID=A0ABP6S7V3_9ACTN
MEDIVPEPGVGPEEFVTPYRDLAHARVLKTSLEVLANGGAGPVLREMAREVLAGRLGLREAMHAPEYAEALGERVRDVTTAWERLPAEERDWQTAQAERLLAEGEPRHDRPQH